MIKDVIIHKRLHNSSEILTRQSVLIRLGLIKNDYYHKET